MVFTDNGRNLVRDFLIGDSVSGILGVAVGTSTTAATVDDSSLGNEVLRKTIYNTDTQDKVAVFEGIILSTECNTSDSSSLGEVGLFNTSTSSSGTIYSRTTFPTIQKDNTIEIQTRTSIYLY